MRFISHRGNILSKDSHLENKPDYINKALQAGFDVEIDVWCIDGIFFLGHDKPRYHVEETYLEDPRFWCHAKNGEALEKMLKNDRIHCFWHEGDRWTLTSQGYIWTLMELNKFEPAETLNGGIFLTNILDSYIPVDAGGICSDYIQSYKIIYATTGLRNPA